MVSISGKPDLSADGADRVIAAAEPLYADLRWGLAAGFFAPVFLAGFLPAIGSSISFCRRAAFGFLAGLDVFSWFTLRRSASIRSTTFSPRGRPRQGGGRRKRRHQTT